MQGIVSAVGGLGLFLFGMATMTSGLRKLAGNRLHRFLATSTKTPLSGVATGTVVTAIVQSSSATTVAAVGFVAAGLLTFPQALGIILGANIGTTVTGWLVALLGFRFSLGDFALPIVFVAALLYLGRQNRRLHGAGKALAGFALIFLGIAFLQDGMAGMRDRFDFSAWDGMSLEGRLFLVVVGGLFTLVTQSSSATVAASLTALHTSVLDLPQAVAVIIGADIGTTATAMLASIGGTTAARRTAVAHVIYNLFVGSVAFFVMPAYLSAASRVLPGVASGFPEIVAVAFHSLFNVAGVVVVLPFHRRFTALVEALVPTRDHSLAARLDTRLLAQPAAALDTLRAVTLLIAADVVRLGSRLLGDRRFPDPIRSAHPALHAISEVATAREFAIRIGERSEDHALDARLLFSLLHVLDHVERMAERLLDARRRRDTFSDPLLTHHAAQSAALFDALAGILGGHPAGGVELEECTDLLERRTTDLEHDKADFRQHVFHQGTQGRLKGDQLDAALDAHRWIRRTTYHAWRISFYVRHSADVELETGVTPTLLHNDPPPPARIDGQQGNPPAESRINGP